MQLNKNNIPITRERVLAALSHVDDPDLKKDLVTLNMIENINIDGKKVSFSVVLTTPACPLKEAIKNACVNAIKLMVNQDAEVSVHMTSRVTADAKNKTLPTVKNIIAISSGKGGVGKSTVAANLAVALSRMGAKVGLIDADIYGPSIPILFGFESERPMVESVGGQELLMPFERHGVKLMSIGVLLRSNQAVVWRGPMASKALQQLIFDTNWGELDYLLVDLPPGTGDIHLTLVQALPVTGAVVITTPQKLAVSDSRKGAEMFRSPQIQVPLLGVVENMSYFTPEEAPNRKYYLMGKGGGEQLALALETILLGQIPIQESISEQGDRGNPVATEDETPLSLAFHALAQRLAQQIAIRNAKQPPTSQVQIKMS